MNNCITNHQETILIIEDNLGDYFLFEEYFSETSFNHNLHHCENLDEAAVFLNNNSKNVSMIFSDLNLPDASELDLVKNLLAVSFPIPVIVLSGNFREGMIKKIKKLGVLDFYLKDNLSTALLEKVISKFNTEEKAGRDCYNDNKNSSDIGLAV